MRHINRWQLSVSFSWRHKSMSDLIPMKRPGFFANIQCLVKPVHLITPSTTSCSTPSTTPSTTPCAPTSIKRYVDISDAVFIENWRRVWVSWKRILRRILIPSFHQSPLIFGARIKTTFIFTIFKTQFNFWRLLGGKTTFKKVLSVQTNQFRFLL